MEPVLVTDLKQWAYCPRVVFYRRIMPGVGKPTFKMEEGKAAQELLESLELRRSLHEYGFDAARRRFAVWLENRDLGLSGKLDLLLEGDGEAAVVDFKLSSGDIAENHRLQLAGYAMLAETELHAEIPCGFLYRIPDNRIFRVEITPELRDRVHQAIRAIQNMTAAEVCPDPTPVRRRCDECEYANYCADVW